MKPETKEELRYELARLWSRIMRLAVSLASWICGAAVLFAAVATIVLTGIADVVPGVDLDYVNLGIDT